MAPAYLGVIKGAAKIRKDVLKAIHQGSCGNKSLIKPYCANKTNDTEGS